MGVRVDRGWEDFGELARTRGNFDVRPHFHFLRQRTETGSESNYASTHTTFFQPVPDCRRQGAITEANRAIAGARQPSLRSRSIQRWTGPQARIEARRKNEQQKKGGNSYNRKI